jgi:hypothetical protein
VLQDGEYAFWLGTLAGTVLFSTLAFSINAFTSSLAFSCQINSTFGRPHATGQGVNYNSPDRV